MPWLIDGSNVLGAERLHDDSKRRLVRLAAAFARAKRTRVACIFDGPVPSSFATHLGSVTIAFSGARSADELIVERAASGRGWNVVTSDRALANRIAGRHVTIVAPAVFLREAEEAATTTESGDEDWQAYFSDPKNRIDF